MLLAQCAMLAPAASFNVLSGASYQSVVAPSSWAVAFGVSLAHTTTIAALDSNGQWPTTLANVTVQVDGQPAALYYVSPGQVNFLVPNGASFGIDTVVINDANGGTQTSSILVRNTAVGIFTSNSSGSGPGAILNGVTYASAPFLVETPENGGTDLRTRLAVYATGLRYAGNASHDASFTNVAANVTAQAQDKAGHTYNLAVEYAGAAPGYFGLDQVNVVLPAELDSASVVSLSFTAESLTSNVVTFAMNSLPASSIRLAGLTLSSSLVTAGDSLSGTVALNGLAKAAGFPVSVRGSLAALQLPGMVTVPEGQASTTFTIFTTSSAILQTATITAQAGIGTQTAGLEIDPATQVQLSLFTVSPQSAQGGAVLTGTIGLTGTSTLGGVNVQVASDDTAVQPPALVTIPFNRSSATFSLPTSTVAVSHTVTLTAILGTKVLTAVETILPAVQISLSDDAVTGGGNVTATVTLGKAAPVSGATITLQSSDTGAAQVPTTLTLASGQTTATFTITTNTVTTAHNVTITATYAAVAASQTATLTVNPLAAGQLESVAVAPTTVTGGATATGTITLSGAAPAGGLLVQLKTSNIFTATVPSFVTLPQGKTTVTFTINTSRVASSQTATITATAGGLSRTATLTVN